MLLALPSPAQADGPGVGPPAIVSMGDSSISGEGGRWAGNTVVDTGAGVDALGPHAYWDNADGEKIPGCHRSPSAEVHIGVGVLSENLACSGSMTTTWNINGDTWKPGLDSAYVVRSDGTKRYGQVVALQKYAQTHNVKAILVGVSANDYGFTDVVKRCAERYFWTWFGVKNYCSTGTDDADIANKFSAANVERISQDILNAVYRIQSGMLQVGYKWTDYKIILQTYWSSIPRGSGINWPEYDMDSHGNSRIRLGGCPVFNDDATWLNDVVLHTINDGIKSVAAKLNSYHVDSPQIVVLDMRRALVGHRLCEKGVGKLEEFGGLTSWTQPGAVDLSEWAVPARPPQVYTNYYEIVESAHANYWGQLAMRNCLRQAFNGGNVRGGACVYSGEKGLTSQGEPKMVLQ
jgi:hypothetical protein